MPIQKITPGVVDTSVFSSPTISSPIISGNLSLDSTGTTGVRVPSANTLAFYEGGVEAMRIDSSGNMGIGSSSISNKLEVVQSASADASVAVRAATDGYAASLKLISNNATGSRYNTLNSFYGSTEQWSIRSGAADSTMTFCTGSSATERMRINSNGYVTMPSQPSFLAAASFAVETYAAGAKIQFDTIGSHNTGNHYNTTNRRFTAPVTGVYLFSISMWCQAGGSPQIILRVNNAEVRYSTDVTMLAGSGTSGNKGYSIILKLSANDYVEPYTRIDGGSGDLYGRHSHFSGHLLG